MTAHLDPYAAAPELVKLWLCTSNSVMQNFDPKLAALVEMRASQINACANCLNMHSAEARAHGETEQRLYLLSAWREAPVYTDRERAALVWTDALTRLSEGPKLEEARAALQAEFSAEEQVRLTMLINIINGWNRLAVGFGLFVDPARARGVSADFDALRPKLTRVAYRMLGSVADAEDVVQEAFIRWMKADRADVRAPEAFLRRTVTRLCLDQLKSARRRRETYLGPWLPEPLVEEQEDDDVTLPLMLALERLSPLERAAFLLHDVFGLGFDEVAASVGREEAACRQLAARARAHVREARPRFAVDKQRGLELAEAFFAASRSGDAKALSAMLAQDVAVYADGGGKRPAALKPILGLERVLKNQLMLAKFFHAYGSTFVRAAYVNGLPGFVTREADGELQTTALQVAEGRIAAIYVVRNPDKLRHLH